MMLKKNSVRKSSLLQVDLPINIAGIFLNRKKIYWVISILVMILSYGFLIANPSIGIDDENFEFYFEQNEVAMSGRYGYLFFHKIFKSMRYLPFWREMLGLLFILLGVTILCELFYQLSEKKFNTLCQIIFSCLILTSPIIGQLFVYISICTEVGLIFLCSAIATYATFFYILYKKKLAIFLTIFMLLIDVSMIENGLNYYLLALVIGFSILYFSTKKMEVFENAKIQIAYIVKQLLFAVALILVALIINKIIKEFLLYFLGFEKFGYASSYVVWNHVDILSYSISFCKYFFVTVYNNAKETITVLSLALACGIYFFYGLFNTKKKKNIIPVLAVLLFFVLTFFFYLVTGNLQLPLRIFVVFSLALAFLFSFFLMEAKSKYVKFFLILFSLFTVWFQIQEINVAVQEDRQRYIVDSNNARDINQTIEEKFGGIPSVPVVFIGDLNSAYYKIRNMNGKNDINLNSIMGENGKSYSLRIHRFFEMQGYYYDNPIHAELDPLNYKDFSDNSIVKEATEISEQMPEWPNRESVRVEDDFVVVKLSSVGVIKMNCEYDEFLKELGVRKSNIMNAKVEDYALRDHALYIDGYAFDEDKLSIGTNTKIVLTHKEHHLVYDAKEYERKDLKEKSRFKNNKRGMYIGIPQGDLKYKNYDIRVILTNGDKSEISDVIKTIKLP